MDDKTSSSSLKKNLPYICGWFSAFFLFYLIDKSTDTGISGFLNFPVVYHMVLWPSIFIIWAVLVRYVFRNEWFARFYLAFFSAAFLVYVFYPFFMILN